MQHGHASTTTAARRSRAAFRRIALPAASRRPATSACERTVERFPFVPADPARLEQDCYEAYNIQVAGPGAAAAATGIKQLVIGVSGGLDSTHALIVAAKALDLLGLPREQHPRLHHAGLRHRRANQGQRLAADEGARRHRRGDRHPPGRRRRCWPISAIPSRSGEPVYDVTFENVQAGLRTDYLFRLANQHGGIVIGTGDLSELALGWCTYGVGDQMAHYNVNAGVPKTLIQHLIRWVHQLATQFEADVAATLHAILATEISPELVPAERTARCRRAPRARSAPTRCRTSTCTTRCATASRRRRSPSWRCTPGATRRGRVAAGFPAERAQRLRPARDPAWLEVFLRRFFAFSQFKRSAMPNGPKVIVRRLAVAARRLARAVGCKRGTAWLAELERNVPN